MDVIIFVSGVLSGWLTAYFFYQRAKRGADVQHDQQLEYLRANVIALEEGRQRDHTIIIALHRAGLIEAAFDNGNLTGGYVIRGSIAAQLENATASFVGTTAIGSVGRLP